MAKYQWTGEDETAGNAPTLFESIWDGTINDWVVNSDPEAEYGGKVIEFAGTEAAGYWGLQLIAAGSANSGKIDCRGRFWRNAAGSMHFARLLMSGGTGSEYSVYAGQSSVDTIGLFYYLGNTFTNGSEFTDNSLLDAGWYKFHMTREADETTTLKVWKDGASEPSAPQASAGKQVLPPGGIGFGTYANFAGKIDWLTFGTDGDSADVVPDDGTTPSPVLTDPLASANSDGSYSGSVTTNTDSGTIRYVISTRSGKPTVGQISSGDSADGSPATDNGAITVTSSGVQQVSGIGLSESTTYYLHAYHEGAGGNSNIVTSSPFSYTAAVEPLPVPTAPTVTQVTHNSAEINWNRGV